ncbi:MAG: hypothetical protein K2X29_00360, partial [Candidatus Obscuribacterales bacterium]|nr:hypothetical protein [Candidatus Obscuribacterales bacterium]
STKNLSVAQLGQLPRIVKRVEQYFSSNTLNVKFNHFAPSRVGLGELGTTIQICDDTLNRFEKLFKRINTCLPAN